MICLSGEQIQISQIYPFTKFNSFLADISIFYPLKISLSLSLFSSRNSTYCEKARLLTHSKYYVILDTRGIVCLA